MNAPESNALESIALICIDKPPVNALSQAVRQQLLDELDQAEANPAIKAVVIACAGRTFVAGADIAEFDQAPQAPELSDVLYRIDQCPKPVVAALFGTVLGGGFELAMACHYRLAASNTQVGLPEVNLGLIPGAGGTQWLPRLAGLPLALDKTLSGKPKAAATLVEAGVIDQLIAVDAALEGVYLKRVLHYTAQVIAAGAQPRPVSVMAAERSDKAEAALKRWRSKAAHKFRGQIAPQAIIDSVEDALTLPFQQGQARARERFLQCKASPQSRAMRHAFFAERKASKLPVTTPGKTLAIDKVAVIGAGTMGTAIALCFANAGIAVCLLDLNQAALDRGWSAIKQRYQNSLAQGRINEAQQAERLGKLSTSCDYASLADCDLVIEAAFENLAVKQDIFKQLDRICKPEAILASNTSYLDIDAIAGVTQRPQQVLGLHFFSPADVMKLLEVVQGAHTSAALIQAAVTLAKRLGKIPVLVGNAYGFVGNRMYTAYGREAQMLLLEGATPAQVDTAMTAWGMAMGPFAVNDLSGIDIAYKARRENPNLPDDPCYFRPADLMVEAGRLGQKTGAGFYRYCEHTGERQEDNEVLEMIRVEAQRLGVPQNQGMADEAIAQRLIAALIAEGEVLLEQGIARCASDIDVIWLNGYGFPRFRGGPMWLAAEGIFAGGGFAD